MRFFTLLPFLPIKSRLVSLSKQSSFHMHSPARPMGQSLLHISIGLSGLVATLCPSAIASSLPMAKKPSSETISQTLLTDLLEDRPLSPESSSSPSNAPSIQTLLPPLDSAVDLQTIDSPQTQPQTPICQSLQNCDHTFTNNIDAASATALGAPVEALSGLETDVSAIDTKVIDTKVINTEVINTEVINTEVTKTEVTKTESAVEIHGALKREALLTADPPTEISSDAIAQIQPFILEEKQDSNNKKTKIADSLDDLVESATRRIAQPQLDDELGTIRASPLRSRGDEDLGILRLLQRAAAPPKPKTPIAFLTGRLGYFNSQNPFRLDTRASDQVYQAGISLAAFPPISEDTSLYAIAETNLGRFERADDDGYNEVEIQAGIRQKLFPRTYAQVGLRNQRFYPFDRKILNITYLDAVVSHRSIFNSRTWLDSFYQARLGFANDKRSSRFRQTLTLSLNYGISKDLRASLLYQLDLEDYTQISRYDVYQQVIGNINYRLTPESQISLFGGTRFGNSSSSDPALAKIDLDDIFYGAGLTVNLPLF